MAGARPHPHKGEAWPCTNQSTTRPVDAMAEEPSDAQKVTLGEVYRLSKETRDEIRLMRSEMVTRAEWSAYQLSIDRRFLEVERRQDEWKRESQEDHVTLAATDEKTRGEMQEQISTLRKDVTEAAEKQRDSRAKIWIGIGMAGLAAILPRLIELFMSGGAAG